MRPLIKPFLILLLAAPNAAPSQSDTTPTPPPQPNAQGIYRVGNGVTAPQPISMPDPEFSEVARRKKIAGDCTVGLIVDTAGIPQNVHVVKSIAEGLQPKLRTAAQSLDEKAVKAVREYRFKPATFEGKPVPVEMSVQVNFQIF